MNTQNYELELDLHRFRGDLTALVERIRTLKRALRTTWARPMGQEQAELARLRTRATELCALRAYCRGKFHVVRALRGCSGAWDPLAYHQRIVARLGPVYAKALEQSA